MTDTEPRFVVDAMLGSLATWLRILGYDALYDASLDDHQLVRAARAGERVLLTRDTQLARRRGVQCLLVHSQTLEEQLAEVFKTLDLELTRSFGRCPVCNTPLEDVPKGEAWGQVPPFVFQTQEHFTLCPECNQFYWRGTHWQQMTRRIDSIVKPSKSHET